MSDLKPCPFCGGEAQVDEDCGKYVVHCKNPDCSWRDTEAEAIAAWNARAERTCRIETRNGDQYCTRCGEMVGTCDIASELYVSGNMVEMWNYCPNCGAKVVDA